MELRFIIALNEHHKLGNIFLPYLVHNQSSHEYCTVYERVTLLNLSKYQSIISPEGAQIVKIIEEYSDQSLQKIFSKKKDSLREFLKGISEELFQKQIRPYIERRMARCVEIFSYNPVPMYFKKQQNNIYESDRITDVNDECSAVFNFIKGEEDSRYYLSIEYNGNELQLKGKEATILVHDPCHVVINNKLFVFNDIDSKKITPFFTKDFITIPKSAEHKFFEGFVRNAIKKFKVHTKGFIIEDINTDPKSVLSVARDLNGRFFIILKFVYGNNNVYFANRKTDLKVICEFSGDNVLFTRLKRNFEFENDCIARLLSFGLTNNEGSNFLPLQKNQGVDENGFNVINWINFNTRALHDAGFDICQDKLEQNFYLDEMILKFEVSEQNNDWFDIHAQIEFDGFKIPFVKFYDHILNNDRLYELPDGRIFILPEEWFEAYRDVLNFSKVEKDTFRLDKQHFHLLYRSKRALSYQFKDNLRNLLNSDREPEIVPDAVHATLRKYQVDGYSWLYCLYKNRFGGCLADDMGLGKTLQTLVLLKRVISESKGSTSMEDMQKYTSDIQLSLFEEPVSRSKKIKASLIVVPTSLVHNWINEALRFVPDLVISAYTGGQRRDLMDLSANTDIIVTSYGILRNDLEKFINQNFFYVILDESQMVKNPGSKTYFAVMQLKAENKLTLTGTPIENSLTDLWSQLNFLNPGLLGNLNFFRTEFQLPIEKKNDELKREKLQKLIAPFILRRSKMEVAPDLPPVNEQVLLCNLDDNQEEYYEKEKSRIRNFLIERIATDGFNKSAIVILQSLTRLRQIANHPVLIDNNYFGGSGKFDEIQRNLESIRNEGHKALVFSSFVKHLELLATSIQQQNTRYAWLTGETPEKDRKKVIHEFQTDPDCPFFLISLKAGGLGLNLTAADYIFILDPWWNPKAELQAISRAHRIGQDKSVFVYRFISKNTLEEKIIKLQERKSEIADAFINENLRGIAESEVMELFE